MPIRHVAGLLALIFCLSSGDLAATETLRIATYNIQALGSGSQATALANVLGRIDADILLLQEVKNAEAGQVAGFAVANGYPYSAVSSISGTMSGALRNAVISRFPINAAVSWSAATASGDPSANDITRDIFQAEISVPQVCEPVAVFTVHLKASTSSTNKFRRAVELVRVRKVIEAYAQAHPNANIFFGGDMNEDSGDAPFGQTFSGLPSGLPASYKLGNDISFPVVYDPFAFVATIGGLGLTAVAATHEDCATCDATRAASGRHLDDIFSTSDSVVLGDEIYASPVDNGTDDGPQGLYLIKAGTPLSAGASAQASDHYTVFADFLLESCSGVRYGAGSSGKHVLVPRAGITGTGSIGDAGFGLRALYAAPNAPVILVLGQARLLPPTGFFLAPWVPGAFLHISLGGLYGLFPGVTDGNGEATFALPLPADPAAIGASLNSQWFVTDPGAPNGVGAMTDAYELIIQP